MKPGTAVHAVPGGPGGHREPRRGPKPSNDLWADPAKADIIPAKPEDNEDACSGKQSAVNHRHDGASWRTAARSSSWSPSVGSTVRPHAARDVPRGWCRTFDGVADASCFRTRVQRGQREDRSLANPLDAVIAVAGPEPNKCPTLELSLKPAWHLRSQARPPRTSQRLRQSLEAAAVPVFPCEPHSTVRRSRCRSPRRT